MRFFNIARDIFISRLSTLPADTPPLPAFHCVLPGFSTTSDFLSAFQAYPRHGQDSWRWRCPDFFVYQFVDSTNRLDDALELSLLIPNFTVSILWYFTPRSLKYRSAFFVSKHLFFPNICMFIVNSSYAFAWKHHIIGNKKEKAAFSPVDLFKGDRRPFPLFLMICLLILLIAQHDFFRQAPKLRRVWHFSPVLAQFLLYPFRKSREIVVVIITYNIDNSRHIAAAIIILVQNITLA